jgi:glutathione S-transferase
MRRRKYLFYWGFKGRAQPIRDALRIGHIEFEDNTTQNFEQFKVNPDNCPLATWPVLDVDGERFCESNALLFYVGRLANLVPTSPKEELRVLEVLEVVEDLLVTLG